mmetsp:Transcript_19968/g.46779  ORF Transcript_19968/g.46779 Transcript_19968/m.46779 type:complete len:86 (-) Transcript_19968:77-334(-)
MVKTKGRGGGGGESAPSHYKPSYNQVEERSPVYSVPKVKLRHIVDKESPGPGTYATHTFNDDKLSRGTKQLQLRGLTRSPLSGYF